MQLRASIFDFQSALFNMFAFEFYSVFALLASCSVSACCSCSTDGRLSGLGETMANRSCSTELGRQGSCAVCGCLLCAEEVA